MPCGLWLVICRFGTFGGQDHAGRAAHSQFLAQLVFRLHRVVASLAFDVLAALGFGQRVLPIIGTPDRHGFVVRLGTDAFARKP